MFCLSDVLQRSHSSNSDPISFSMFISLSPLSGCPSLFLLLLHICRQIQAQQTEVISVAYPQQLYLLIWSVPTWLPMIHLASVSDVFQLFLLSPTQTLNGPCLYILCINDPLSLAFLFQAPFTFLNVAVSFPTHAYRHSFRTAYCHTKLH